MKDLYEKINDYAGEPLDSDFGEKFLAAIRSEELGKNFRNLVPIASHLAAFYERGGYDQPVADGPMHHLMEVLASVKYVCDRHWVYGQKAGDIIKAYVDECVGEQLK